MVEPVDEDSIIELSVAMGCCFFFQKAVLGPFIMNASVQRDSPRNASVRCEDAVRRADKERINVNLSKATSIQVIET